jgi:hypothetical protein
MILILLVILLLLSYLFVQKWLPARLRLTRITETKAKQDIKVWAVKRTGMYYCADSNLYGEAKPGMLMTQEKALEGGYRPAGGETCR